MATDLVDKSLVGIVELTNPAEKSKGSILFPASGDGDIGLKEGLDKRVPSFAADEGSEVIGAAPVVNAGYKRDNTEVKIKHPEVEVVEGDAFLMNEDIDVVPGENPIAVGTEEGGAKDHQVFSVPSFAFSSEFSLDPAGVCIEDVGLTRSSVFASREKQTAEKPLHGDKLISGAIVSSLEKKVSGSDDGEGSKVVASSGEQGDAGLVTMMAEKLPKANSAVFFKTPAALVIAGAA
ncbi:hypothetical protein U1Q18_014547 [Sarracenia purpurea var. burkii]